MPELFFQDFPGSPDAPPLVLLHGLFGSSVNWRAIARRLGGARRVLAMDLRNHGRSPHDARMTYPAMADDVLETLRAADLDCADILGHSMGGKTAMVLALEHPGACRRLLVADIAPVIYTHSHLPLIEALRRLDVAALESRRAADAALASDVDDPMLRQFLLQSLEPAESGYRWRLNLEALASGMEDLVGFPELNGGGFDGPTLFLYGANSDYVQPEQHPRIEHYFPNAQFRKIDHAGHWLHAEQPAALVRAVAEFIDVS